MFKLIIRLGAVLVLLAIVGGFFGGIHPAFDTLSVFRVHLGLLSIPFAVLPLLWRGKWAARIGMLGCGIAIIGLWSVLLPPVVVSQPQLVGYQHNLRYDNRDLDQVLAAIDALDPDFLLLQELSDANLAALAGLTEAYPNQIICPGAPVGAVAVYSRLPPFGEPGCARNGYLAWMEVQAGDGLATLASIHLNWPWPYEQHQVLGRLLPELEQMKGRIILGGDFNAVPWSRSVSSIAQATNTRPIPGFRPSFQLSVLRPALPIDLTLTHADIRAEAILLGHGGSDHRATELRLEFGQ